MNEIRRIRPWLCIVAAALLINGSAMAETGITARGVTLPSKIAELSFLTQGRVQEVLVKPGETVTAGQPLVLQDDRREASALEILNLQAASTLSVQAAEAELETATVRHKRLEELGPRNTSPTELEEARLAVKIAQLKLQLAREEQVEKGLHVNRQEVMVEQMRLISPIDGLVERVDANVGQIVDASRPSCVVVKIDPLWVEVRQLRSHQIGHLRPGQTVQVRPSAEDEWTDAEIIFISAVGDPASGTQLVRLELPNPDGRASGQEVQVKIPSADQPAHAHAVEN